MKTDGCDKHGVEIRVDGNDRRLGCWRPLLCGGRFTGLESWHGDLGELGSILVGTATAAGTLLVTGSPSAVVCPWSCTVKG